MRVLSRVALVVIVLGFISLPAHANHLQGDCPLTLSGANPASSDFNLSPHGVFRTNGTVFGLRGQTLTTYTVTDLGDMNIAREDFIGSMGARETNGGVAFSNGYLYVSSEAGLEIFDLRNVRAGGSAPTLVSRTPGLHYRKLAVSGNTLAAVYPAIDLPCYPTFSTFCFNTIDLFDVSNRNAPVQVGRISSLDSRSFVGWNDVAFNQGYLFATGEGGTIGFNVNDPSAPVNLGQFGVPGKWLVSNGTTLFGVGNEGSIDMYKVALSGSISRFATYTLPFETINRANPIMFGPDGAFIDDQNGRLITLVDEKDPATLKPARTIAFDVFDFTVPMWEGSDERIYENVSYVSTDEVKYDPVASGTNVYVVGTLTGLETYGACGQVAGKIEWDGSNALNCGGAELRGWVTGAQKLANVEVFLDNGSLGTATVAGPPRIDVSSKTPVLTWRLAVNLDQTPRGEHIVRAVGTDALGNRRQFAAQRIFFGGPGQNCINRRRAAGPR